MIAIAPLPVPSRYIQPGLDNWPEVIRSTHPAEDPDHDKVWAAIDGNRVGALEKVSPGEAVDVGLQDEGEMRTTASSRRPERAVESEAPAARSLAEAESQQVPNALSEDQARYANGVGLVAQRLIAEGNKDAEAHKRMRMLAVAIAAMTPVLASTAAPRWVLALSGFLVVVVEGYLQLTQLQLRSIDRWTSGYALAAAVNRLNLALPDAPDRQGAFRGFADKVAAIEAQAPQAAATRTQAEPQNAAER